LIEEHGLVSDWSNIFKPRGVDKWILVNEFYFVVVYTSECLFISVYETKRASCSRSP